VLPVLLAHQIPCALLIEALEKLIRARLAKEVRDMHSSLIGEDLSPRRCGEGGCECERFLHCHGKILP